MANTNKVRRIHIDLGNYTEMMVLIIILFFGYCQCAVTVTPQQQYIIQGSSINIVATTDEDAVTWTYKSGQSLSLCIIPESKCAKTKVENMDLSADNATKTSTIAISSVNCSINTAVYTATSTLGVASADIKVTIPESSVDVTTTLSTEKVSTQELSFDIPCVFPQPVANFTIARQGKPDETISAVTGSSSNSGCSCTEAATYTIKTTITASNYPDEVVVVKANVGQLSPVVIGTVNFTGPTVTTEMSSTGTSQDQTTSSQNPSIASFHNTQKTETTIMTTTDNDLTSASLHVSSEVTMPIKTESDNLTDLGVSAIIAIVISGFIFLFLIIILIICCCQYYWKNSKKKTSEKFQEIHDDVVPTFWPNFIGNRYGINGINGSTVHVARSYNQYQGESDGGYNVPSTNQSDNFNCRRSNSKYITENPKHKSKQSQEKISHGFPQSIPDDTMNRYDINGKHTYASLNNNQNTRMYYRGQAVLSPRRFEYREAFLPHEYNNHNRRSSPYMTYLQEHVPRDLEGLTIYQGHNRATNKRSRRYY